MGSRTATILVTDLVGSTELRVRVGEERAEELRRAHDEMLTDAVTRHNGTAVKWLGDGVLAMFTGAADAVAAAVEIQQSAAVLARREPDRPTSIRVGISAGDVTVEQGDCFGTPVVEASRLCAAAAGGQILAADIVPLLARNRGGHVYLPVGDLDLKGLPQAVTAVEVTWNTPAEGGPGMPFPTLLEPVHTFPFTGRERERELMWAAWKEASIGEPRTVLVSGEPGIGKTRLAAEIAAQAHRAGATVLYGRSDEDLEVPYQPFVEALRWAATCTPAGALRTSLGRFPGDLVRLLPELPGLVSDLEPPLSAEPEVERYRLFEAVASWLVAAGEPHGVVLVVDDLHWAARPTLLLLRHIVGRAEPGRVMVVGTYRDTDVDRTHPLYDVLADLRRAPTVERIALPGLDASEVEAFLAAASGNDLDTEGRALASAVFAETEGNPFFVGEVLRHLVESRAIVREDGHWRPRGALANLSIPEGAREVIGRRLSRLSPETNDVLRAAAAIGRDLDLGILVDIVGQDHDEVLGSLEEAVHARVVDEIGPDRYRFSHALVRSTLYEELRTTRRVRLHRKIAEAYERNRPDDLAALAHHWQEAAGGGSVAEAVDATRRAAEQALCGLAHSTAAELYRQALDLADEDSTDPATRCDLLLGLAEAMAAIGGTDHRSIFDEAVKLSTSLGDGERLARAVIGQSRGYFSMVFQVRHDVIDRIETALRLLPDGDSTARATLLALLSAELHFADEPQRLLSLADDAVAMARRTNSVTALARALAIRCDSVPWPVRNDPDAAGADLEELEALAAAQDQPALRSLAANVRIMYAMNTGDFERADDAIVTLARSAAELGHARYQWHDAYCRAGYHLARGNFDEAERATHESLELGHRAGQRDADAFWGNLVTLLARERGDEELPTIAQTVIDRRLSGYREWQATWAMTLLDAGRFDEGSRHFREAYEAFHGHGSDLALLPTGAALAFAAADIGDRQAAARLIPVLEPYARLFASWGALSTVGPITLPLGRLRLLLGDTHGARRDLLDAEARTERAGLLPTLARCRLHLAEVAREQGELPEADARARSALELAEPGGFRSVARRSHVFLDGLRI